MTRLDVPLWGNAGGLLLVLCGLLATVLIIAALVDVLRPRCHECDRATKVAASGIVRAASGRYVLLCPACRLLAGGDQPITWPGPRHDHASPEEAAREWQQWQQAGRPPIPGLWP